jgi:rod shape-determining protein MreD
MQKKRKIPKLINGAAIARLLGINPKIKTLSDKDKDYLIEGNSFRDSREAYDSIINGKRIAAAVLISFFSVIIQEALFNDLRLFGTKPDLSLVFVIIIASLSKTRFSMLYGLFTGLYIDICYGEILGLYGLLFMYFALFISAVVRPAVKGRVLIMSAISVPLLLVYCFTDSFFSRVLTIYSAEHTTLYYEFAEHVTSRILPEFLYDSIVFLILVIPVTFLWTALSKSSIKGYKMF